LDQLGFRKQIEYAFRPLLLKSAFTVMFWASCRQYMSEREIEKGQSALGNMMVNQQITVAMVKPNAKKGLLVKIGILVNAILVKFWIWAVALTLFMSGFSGSKMTVFRILYMALFLIFVLYFQVSRATMIRGLIG
jgi:piezo-type mechanosensitive ion channel component 1/2